MSEQKKYFINGPEFVSLNNVMHVELCSGMFDSGAIVIKYFGGESVTIRPNTAEATAEVMYQKIWEFI